MIMCWPARAIYYKWIERPSMKSAGIPELTSIRWWRPYFRHSRTALVFAHPFRLRDLHSGAVKLRPKNMNSFTTLMAFGVLHVYAERNQRHRHSHSLRLEMPK